MLKSKITGNLRNGGHCQNINWMEDKRKDPGKTVPRSYCEGTERRPWRNGLRIRAACACWSLFFILKVEFCTWPPLIDVRRNCVRATSLKVDVVEIYANWFLHKLHGAEGRKKNDNTQVQNENSAPHLEEDVWEIEGGVGRQEDDDEHGTLSEAAKKGEGGKGRRGERECTHYEHLWRED